MATMCPFSRAVFVEATMIAPTRDRSVDGSVRTRKGPPSDHYADGKNPGAPGIVHAIDITYDPPEFDAHWEGELIRRRCEDGAENRLTYLVSHNFDKGHDIIASPTRSGLARRRWQWRKKTGRAHRNHLHISFKADRWVEQSTAPLFRPNATPAPPVPPPPLPPASSGWPPEWSADVPQPNDFVGMLSTEHGAWKVKANGDVFTMRGTWWGNYGTLPPEQRLGSGYITAICRREDDPAAPGYTLIRSDGSLYKFGPGLNGAGG